MAKKNTDIVKMVQEQAKTGRKVIGLIAENKVDANKRYALTAYDAEDSTLTFTEILPEDADEAAVASVVKITKENAPVMRYVKNPNEKPVPDADVITKDGQKFLKFGDRNVFLGTIQAIRAVAAYNGEVILGVEASNPNSMELLRYDVQNDKFDAEPFAAVSKGTEVFILDGQTYLVDNQIDMIPQVDADGNPVLDADGKQIEKPLLVDAALYHYLGECHLTKCILVNEDDDTMFEAPIDDVRLIEQGERKDIAIVTSYLTDADGYMEKSDVATIHLYRMHGLDLEKVGEFDVSDPEAKVYLGGSFKKKPVITVKDKDRILIRDPYGIHVVDNPTVAAAMEGFNYFCGTVLKCDEDDNEVIIYTYANKEMAVKSFSMTKTDRGILFAVM